MSYWSSLVLARMGPATLVTGTAIGAFLRRLVATEALAGGEEPQCEIKYGPRLDADERGTDVIEWDESGRIGVIGEYPWDVSKTFPSVSAMADYLAADERSVYRAFLNLGNLRPDIIAALTREPSEENEQDLMLGGLSFSVGPVLVSGLTSEMPAFVGWMGLVLSGPGYFYPWKFREARERAEAVEPVGRLAAACRAAWPVAPNSVSAEVIAGRQQLAELWLYDDFALPHDWLWFATET